MQRQLALASARLAALWASDCERAVLVVLVELGLARQYAFAPFALEMVVFEVLGKRGLIWPIKATARLQAMLVLLSAC
jgi:hypothetical protein